MPGKIAVVGSRTPIAHEFVEPMLGSVMDEIHPDEILMKDGVLEGVPKVARAYFAAKRIGAEFMASWSMIVAANPAVLLCFPRVGGTEVFSHEETEALLAALRNGVEVRIRPLDAGRIRNTKRRSNDRG